MSETRENSAAEARQVDVRVSHEPRTYAADSPHSFFRDLAFKEWDRDATQRMAAHGREVLYEIDHHTPEGRRAETALRNSCRQKDPTQHQRQFKQLKIDTQVEVRTGISTGAASLGSLVTPGYVLEQWAPFRGYHRVFADQMTKLPIPAYGMAVHVPSLTTTASAGVQALGENTAVSETDPSGSDLTTSVQLFTGQLTISQQLQDRGFHDPTYAGGGFDVVAGQQIKQLLDETINRYCWQQVLQLATQATASAATSSFLADFYGDVGDCRNKLTDTTGVRIRGTHVFTTADLYSYATRQLDINQRPILLPQFNPGAPQILDGRQHEEWWGFTGTVLPGVLFWFTDDTIPAFGSNTTIAVSDPTKVLLFESDPMVFSWAQTYANQLSVVVGMREYVACIPRYPGATAFVTGSQYPTTLS